MSKNNDGYVPSGQLQGDTSAMPDRGTGTGLNGDSYGADLSSEALNRLGSIGSAAQSDAPFDSDADSNGEKDGDE